MNKAFIAGLLLAFIGAAGFFSYQKVIEWASKTTEADALKTKAIISDAQKTKDDAQKVIDKAEQEKPWQPLGNGASKNLENGTPRNNTSRALRQLPNGNTLIGVGPTGYTMEWDGQCIIVNGITEADMRRMNTDVWAFKAEIKRQTGAKCVFYE